MKRTMLLAPCTVAVSAVMLLSACPSDDAANGSGGMGGSSSAGVGGSHQSPAMGGNFLFQSDATKNDVRAKDPRTGGGYVYWLWEEGYLEGLDTRRLQRKAVEGGPVEDVAGPNPIDDYQADAEHIYWLQRGQIWRRPHAGGSPQQLTQASTGGFNLAVGKSVIFTWAPTSKTYTLVTKSSGELTAGREENRILSVLAEDDAFYVMLSVAGATLGDSTGTIMAMTSGVAPHQLAQGISGPGRLVGVVGPKIYLTTENSLLGGKLTSLDKAGGGLLEALGNQDWRLATSLISDGVLYGSANNALQAGGKGAWQIVRYALGGDAWVQISEMKKPPDGLAVAGNWLLWIHEGDLYRAPRL